MDMKMLQKLMEKKKGGDMDPEYKNAKMGVLKGLHDEMGKMMGDEVKGIKKVTVAAPDKAGLAEGLQKAEDLLGGKTAEDEESEEGEMCDECGGMHEMHEPHQESEDLDSIEAQIKELEAKKLALMGK